MRSLAGILLLIFAGLARAEDGIELREAGRRNPDLHVAARVVRPGRLEVTLENRSKSPITVRVERGTVFAGARDQGCLVVLRSAAVSLAAQSSAEMSLPAVALSTRKFQRDQAFTVSESPATGLEAVLDYFATADDVPAVTAQLLVLCIVEDVNLATWRNFLAAERAVADPATLPTQEDIVSAIDVLGILRKLDAKRTFALASDAELKLRALRNPLSRPRAMQLYGLALPEAAPLPPELGTLLHLKPGDNCPICRQRALMQPREDGL